MQNLKDLKKLIALCRAQGVTSIEMDGIKLELGAIAPKTRAPKTYTMPDFDPGQVPSFEPVQDEITTDELSAEDLLFYSATAHGDAQ